MLYILILILVWKKIPSVNSEPIIEPIFKKWIENFETIEKFSAFSKSFVSQKSSENSEDKIVQFSEFDAFEFSGSKSQSGLPQGFGTLANVDYEGGNQKCCFKAMCKKVVVRLIGNFTDGFVTGIAEISYSDGTFIRGQTLNSALNGLVIEFDSQGRQTFAGLYKSGRRSKSFYIFGQNPASILLSRSSGKGLLVVIDPTNNAEYILAGKLENNCIGQGKFSKLSNSFIDETGMLVLEEEIIKEDSFDFQPGITHLELNPEELLGIQSNWLLHKRHHNPLFTPFLLPDVKNLSQRIDTLKLIKKPEGCKNCGSSLCDEILKSIAYIENTFVETPLVASLGSGSKWVGGLIDWTTGVQNYNGAFEFYTPQYKRGSSLIIKTHHAMILETNEPRRRENLFWRLSHLQRFNGRGILLIRNPYTAIISHWNHRNARDEISSLQNLKATLLTKKFRSFAKLELLIWLDIAMDWLTISSDLIVVHYEDFLLDPIPQLKTVHQFLKYPLDEERLSCVAEIPFERWKRPTPKEKVQVDPFEDENLHELFDTAICQVQEKIISKNLDPMPIENYKYMKSSCKN